MTSSNEMPIERSRERTDIPWPVTVAAIVAVVIAVFVMFRRPGPKDPFELTEHEVAVNDANIEAIIQENEVALIDFSASWCGPCRMLTPHIQSIAEDYEGRVKVGVVNVDAEDSQDAVMEFGVNGIPHIVITRDGEVVETITGYASYDELKSRVESALAEP